MSKPWQISLLTRWEDIEDPAFVEQWQRIMDGSDNAHVFFHPVLVRVWLDTYRPLRALQPLFVLASRGEQQVVFPLVLWRQNAKNAFLRTIVPAGHSDFDYHDPVFLVPPDDEQVQSFYIALKAELDKSVKYDRIVLDGMHEQSVPDYCKVVHQEPCLQWSLNTAEFTEGLVLPLKKKVAKETMRRMKRLKEQGELTFRHFLPEDAGDVRRSLLVMLEHHKRRWPNAYKAPGFHANLLEQGIKAGIVDFFEVNLGGQPLAWRVCYRYRGKFSLYMPAIDEAFSRYAPGHISLAYALAEAKKSGAVTVDHLRGGEDYKNAWGGTKTLIYDAVFNDNSLSSRMRLGFFKLLQQAKAARARFQVK
ncbi:GNAT family N-acetyltransferase [Marinobacter sp. chi1]|uniref:GNAT family N-acetyltransferase n=1 Tax=Marinobacter suaedae TaxID=3057675 RepID=A0ABT8VWF5_9GAMM|nr:GNAT family N-acetyltransferase [Marinobacter sp. chi1]MDO3720321.1 GNAT family N-acetyltransferase [Marinobacter sp. chi1]